MRLKAVISIVIAVLLLGATAAGAFTPEVNTYSGHTTPGSHRVIFYADTHHVSRFKRDDHELFSSTSLVFESGTWSFHTHNSHWLVKGHWVHPTEVHGSICDLIQSPTGCKNGDHLQTYVAHAKTKQ
jgi:hypothetical protein